jgi:threonylcarbamoyladenosine tRNA methylthiotransferase MtaB
MKRKYSVNEFKELCKYIRSENKFFSITTDYIVGFPTETSKLFKDEVINLSKLKFASMHIFPYSSRKNTAASKYKNQVSDYQKHQRFTIVNEIKHECEKQYLKQFINKVTTVLFEKSKEKDIQIGHSEYCFSVKVKTNQSLTGELHKVKITELKNNHLFGKIYN